MLRAMRTAASGMNAQQLYVDTLANNLANVNTTGFKSSRVDFEDLLYQTLVPPSTAQGQGAGQPVALQVGHGTRPTDTEKIYTQGTTQTTGNSLDLVIQGEGFFSVQMPDGTNAYTRDGAFKVDGTGKLVTAQGYPVQPEITLPADTQSVAITADGQVSVQEASSTTPVNLGQILLARFPNPAGLMAMGGNLLQQSASSGDVQTATPGQVGLGTLQQGALEGSNVQVVEEMVNMIVAQRAFEMNSKAIQTADQMMSSAVNIRTS